MVIVSELVSALDAELVRLGYKPSTMVWYRGCWRRVGKFFESRGVREFSLDVAMAWVDEACGGFFEKEQASTLKPTDVPSRADARRLRGPRVGAAPLLAHRGQAERRAVGHPYQVSGMVAGGWLRRLDGPLLRHGGRGVPRVHWGTWWAGRAGR